MLPAYQLVHHNTKRIDIAFRISNIVLLCQFLERHVAERPLPLNPILIVLAGDCQPKITDFVYPIMN